MLKEIDSISLKCTIVFLGLLLFKFCTFYQNHLYTFQSTFISNIIYIYIYIVITLSIQGRKKFSAGTRAPEDEGLMPTYPEQSFSFSKETDQNKSSILDAMRWDRIVMNDLENIPLGLIVAFASLFFGINATLHSLGTFVFSLARVLHTISYAYSLQPHRAICWFLGWVSVFVLFGNSIIGVFY